MTEKKKPKQGHLPKIQRSREGQNTVPSSYRTEASERRKFTKFDVNRDELRYTFSYNEQESMALAKHCREVKALSVPDLRRIALWKFGRVLEVSDATLVKLSKVAEAKSVKIDDAVAQEALTALVESQGIGYPLASAILKFVNPDVFPIIDVRAYRALTGKKANRNTYKHAVYFDYAEQLAKIAKKKKLKLREVDEQLYEFDLARNGKI